MSKAQKIVQLTVDLALNEGCPSTRWQMESGPTGWSYRCQAHGTTFQVNDVCPGKRVQYAAGSRISLAPQLAEHLVEFGRAVYPTHEVNESESPNATIARVNALMDAQGLPRVDPESMRTIQVEGARGRGHYQRPRDQRLAQDLGVSGDDMEEMRRLAKG